jgi:hypothetical protein
MSKTKIYNFSRHPLNEDFIKIIRKIFSKNAVIIEKNKNWINAKDMYRDIRGKNICLICPISWLLEALYYKINCNIIFGNNEEQAKLQNAFALDSVDLFRVQEGKITEHTKYTCNPTVWTSIKDNSIIKRINLGDD